LQSFISDDLLLNCFRLGQKTESSLPNLPQPALEEAKIFLDFLAWRYQNQSPQGANLIASLRGKATREMTTDEILNLTRGEK
jgi:hypothetical protein